MNNYKNLIPYIIILPFAAGVRGFCGLGSGIVTMTAFSLLDVNLERVSVVLNIVFTVNTLFLLYFSSRRTRIMWRHVLFISIGTSIGIPAGYQLILIYHDLPLFKFFLGIIIVSGSVYFFFPVHLKKRIPPVYGISFGLVTGFIAGAFMSGGPPMTLYVYSQIDDPRDMKGTLQAVFFISSIVRLLAVGVGKIGYSGEILAPTAVVLVPAAVMLFVGHRISEKIDLRTIKKLIYGLIGCFGAIVAVNGMITYLSVV